MPELKNFPNGREALLSFDKDVGPVLSKACLFSDAVLIEKAASLLRNEMLKCKSSFEGHFQKDNVKECVPYQLKQFVDSSLTGVKVGSGEKTFHEEFTALTHYSSISVQLP